MRHGVVLGFVLGLLAFRGDANEGESALIDVEGGGGFVEGRHPDREALLTWKFLGQTAISTANETVAFDLPDSIESLPPGELILKVSDRGDRELIFDFESMKRTYPTTAGEWLQASETSSAGYQWRRSRSPIGPFEKIEGAIWNQYRVRSEDVGYFFRNGAAYTAYVMAEGPGALVRGHPNGWNAHRAFVNTQAGVGPVLAAPDGSLYVTGNINVSVKRHLNIAKLTPEGNVDPLFDPPPFVDYSLSDLQLIGDEHLFLKGWFDPGDGTFLNGLVLTTDGLLDLSLIHI